MPLSFSLQSIVAFLRFAGCLLTGAAFGLPVVFSAAGSFTTTLVSQQFFALHTESDRIHYQARILLPMTIFYAISVFLGLYLKTGSFRLEMRDNGCINRRTLDQGHATCNLLIYLEKYFVNGYFFTTSTAGGSLDVVPFNGFKLLSHRFQKLHTHNAAPQPSLHHFLRALCAQQRGSWGYINLPKF
jgi:hypothetical protein